MRVVLRSGLYQLDEDGIQKKLGLWGARGLLFLPLLLCWQAAVYMNGGAERGAEGEGEGGRDRRRERGGGGVAWWKMGCQGAVGRRRFGLCLCLCVCVVCACVCAGRVGLGVWVTVTVRDLFLSIAVFKFSTGARSGSGCVTL